MDRKKTPLESGAAVQADSSAFVELAATLVKRRYFLLGMTLAGGILAAGIALCLTPLYTASAQIMPPPKPQSLSGALMGQLGAMASSISPALSGLKDPADLFIGILKSRTVTDDVVKRFHLAEVYKVDSADNARKVLAARANFAAGKDSLIKISVEDSDPKRSADIANAFIEELYKQNNRLAVTESAQRRQFFERELQNEEKELATAETGLKDIQQKTGLVQASSQAEATIRAIEQLDLEIARREVALKRLEMGATAENPMVAGARAEIASLRTQLSKLESPPGGGSPANPLIPISAAPTRGMEVLRGMRAVKYHEALFNALSQQYEIAKIDEAKESQVIQILDPAIPPERKSWPPRLLLTLLGAVSFLILGCLAVFAQKEFGAQWRVLKMRVARDGRA